MKLLLLTLGILCPTFTFAQEPGLDNVLTGYTDEYGFNGTILVQRKDSILHFKGYGHANMEFNVPNRPETKYRIASITKLFTSVLVYKSIEDGKMRLDKTIGTYLPEYTGEGRNVVTIHHLLTSTSGIRNIESNGDTVYEKRLSSDEILAQYCSGPLVSEPGKKFTYNNADYVILGKILERVHGQTFKKILETELLIPLHMEGTGLFDYGIVEGLAQCYWRNEQTGVLERDIPYFVENYHASGGMYSNALDLLKFSDALFGYEIIYKKTLDTLLKTDKETTDFEHYASGVWSFSDDAPRISKRKGVSRPGNIWGTETLLFRFPAEEISIIILSNAMGTTELWELFRKIRSMIME
ncbi:serine hydrolase domain-containing protein [Ulvibacterium marinum]|uniref:Class A beta-lactamase-related serine hydrolase n=1 Tax=Ulvibacterium marinum TaxID=2419782 RepID=A0A3B0C2L8_9FLAO|nr:serine hydrolase domain-containing protein [Ulvibacterium marinum]RKN79692.1 class A beta-lactamase-related serine hydrolase [Ulvibacterium marinum]